MSSLISELEEEPNIENKDSEMSTLNSDLNEEPSIPNSENLLRNIGESEVSKVQLEEQSRNTSSEHSESKPSTSSALMYSEYMNTSVPERVNRIFEKKTQKPVMLSYGESPLYRKYSELLKKLKESNDEYPGGWGKKFPIVKVHLLLKRKHDSDEDDEDDDDNEDNSIVICKKENPDSDSSSDDSSDDDDESIVICKKDDNNQELIFENPSVKVEELNESDSESKDSSIVIENPIFKNPSINLETMSDSESKDSSESESKITITEQEIDSISSEFMDSCVDSVLKGTKMFEYDHIIKKQRID